MPDFRCNMLGKRGDIIFPTDITAETPEAAIRRASDILHTSNQYLVITMGIRIRSLVRDEPAVSFAVEHETCRQVGGCDRRLPSLLQPIPTEKWELAVIQQDMSGL